MDLEDFGLQPICALTNQTKEAKESEAPAELLLQGMAHAHEFVSDLTDSSALSQSGSAHSVLEPIPIPTTHAFDLPMDSDDSKDDEPPGVLLFCLLPPPADVKWRPGFTPAQLRQIAETECCAFERNFDFCAKMSPLSDYDWEKQFSPPVSVTLLEFSPESSDGPQADLVPLYLIHENPWLTSTNIQHLWPHTRLHICCNVISNVLTTE